MSKQMNALYEFGDFRLETSERLLRHKGNPIPLTPKAFETLQLLVERSGCLVEKSDFMEEVWTDAVVEEANLARNIWTLRKALGDDDREHRYIETVPKRGYRFIAPVKQVPLEAVDVIVERHVRARIVTEEEEAPFGYSSGMEEQTSATLKSVPEPQLATLSRARVTSSANPNNFFRTWTTSTSAPVLVMCGLIVLAGGLVLGTRNTQPGSAERVDSIAVMPFVHSGDNPDLEYLSDGLTENVINRLSRSSDLKVVARGSVYRYKDKAIDPQLVGRELGVQGILIGKVVQHGSDLSISAELVDARNGRHVWGERYNRKNGDLQFLQSELAQDIANRLRLPLAGEKQTRLDQHTTRNVDAYQLYLKGRYFWNKRNREGIKRAIEFFEQSIRIDPNYSLAYAGLADCYNVLGQLGELSPNEAMPKAKAAALNALRLDDSLAEAHASLALINEVYDWNWAIAEAEFKRAIELNPNYATAHHWYAMYLSAMGRHDEALAEIRRAKVLDPVSLIINANEGWIYFCARQYDRGVEQLRETINMDPNFGNAHYKLALVYEIKGMRDEAVAEYLENERLGGMNQSATEELNAAYAKSGWRGFYQKELKLLEEASKRGYVSPKYFVLTHLQLDNKEQAFRWFEDAYKERAELLVYMKVDPRFDGLRSDPRYENLLRRVNLASQ